jgi:hypothetical protein
VHPYVRRAHTRMFARKQRMRTQDMRNCIFDQRLVCLFGVQRTHAHMHPCMHVHTHTHTHTMHTHNGDRVLTDLGEHHVARFEGAPISVGP